MLIYLVGFMGCGKSTIGKKLANRLGYHFIDLDIYIEQKYMSPIAAIFQKQGEAHFRQLESKSLHEIQGFGQVIATGGGTACFYDNMDWMNRQGTTIYLELSPEALFSRLVNVKYKRPSTKDLSDEELKQFIIQKLDERKPFYEQAQLQLNAFLPELIEKIVEEI